jgi:DNA-binding transcriptional LysR family regulator
MKSGFRAWSDVRVFLAVMRAGSTLAAATVLGLSQPTVARRIGALEHDLGLTLFERDTQGFHPTSDADALLAEAEALEAAAAALARKAGQLTAARSRRIRLTGFRDAFTIRLSSVLEEFLRLHPDVPLDLIPSDDRLDLAAGAADVALRGADSIDDPALICRRIRVIGMSLFASRSYAAQHGLPESDAELAGHRFILRDGAVGSWQADRWLAARITPDQVVARFDGLKGTEAAIMMGSGIGWLPTRTSLDPAHVLKCFDLPLEACPSVWLLISPAAWRRPEVKAFAAFFVPRYRAKFEPA